jgi:hypothetical protein
MNDMQRRKIQDLTRRVDRVQKTWDESPINPNAKIRVKLEDYIETIDDANDANAREAARIRGDVMPLTAREKAQRRF